MADTTVQAAGRPVWVDLASSDTAASREFYARLFGWDIAVSPDPTYGGYAVAQLGGEDVAGIGPKQAAEAPSAWSLYIGSDDLEALAEKVGASGGSVVAPPFAVGDQGRMAVFQDPAGAFISAWQADSMSGFGSAGPGRYGWAELNARGIDRAVPFYEAVFGWTSRKSEMGGEGMPPYTEFQIDGDSVAGGWEMNPAIPAEVPSYWLVYFSVDDVDAALATATGAGGREVMPAQDFPGGRFAIVADPEGASFGLLKLAR